MSDEDKTPPTINSHALPTVFAGGNVFVFSVAGIKGGEEWFLC